MWPTMVSRHVGSIVRQRPDRGVWLRMTGERCAHHETPPARHREGRYVEFLVGAGYGVQTSSRV